MKVKNFPGNKNKRRIFALERLMRASNFVDLKYANDEIGELTKKVNECKYLNSLIIPVGVARAIRTKKYRGK